MAWMAIAAAAPPVVQTEPLTPEQERDRFKLPAGFEIQLVAAEPQIQKPMNMAFDGRGRLWVTHSVEYPFAAAADRKPRDGLTVLEDFGPDGRARKATLFHRLPKLVQNHGIGACGCNNERPQHPRFHFADALGGLRRFYLDSTWQR
jgi:hypothetical protein